VIATDLDRDGRVDLALTSHDSHGVVVLRGDGRGGFTLAPGSPFAALAGGKAHNHGLAAGDLNGDGWPDLTTVDDESHGLAVLLADGSGGFRPAPRSPFPVGREPYPHALGDVDRDGHLDAVVPNVRSGTLGVLIGDGRGGFTDAPGSPIRMEVERPYFVALGDIDGSGSLDAVVTHDDTSRITVLLGDGRGRFSPAPGPALDVGRRPWKAALGDITGDGRLDLVLGGGGQAVVLEGDGHGRFAPLRGSPFPLGREAWSVALADVDGNGRLDIVSADLGQDTVTVLLGR
jgi:hypothetical protein